jgi:hypothetical protein
MDGTDNRGHSDGENIGGGRKYQISAGARCCPAQSCNPPEPVESKHGRMHDLKSWNRRHVVKAIRMLVGRKQANLDSGLRWNDPPEFRQQIPGIDLRAVILETAC